MSRFSPTVLPTAADPLTEALRGLRGGYSQASRAQEERQRYQDQQDRQERIDAQREEERKWDRRLDKLRIAAEGWEEGPAPREMPQYEVGPMAPDEEGALWEAVREGGLLRQQPAPPAPPANAFVPGRGFNLRYGGPAPQITGAQQQTPAQTPGAQPGGFTPSPYPQANLGDRRPSRYQEAAGFHRERPETREEAQHRALQGALGLLHDDDPSNDPDAYATLYRQGVPQGYVDRMAPQREAPRTIMVNGREFEDTPEGHRAALQWRRQWSEANRAPNQNRLPDLRRREREERIAEARGNALTWVRAAVDPDSFASEGGGAPELDRSRVLSMLRAQHGLSADEASLVYEDALADVHAAVRRTRDLGHGAGQGDGGVQLPSGMAQDIDAELGRGKTPEQVEREMREEGVAPLLILRAKAYMRSRSGGG